MIPLLSNYAKSSILVLVCNQHQNANIEIIPRCMFSSFYTYISRRNFISYTFHQKRPQTEYNLKVAQDAYTGDYQRVSQVCECVATNMSQSRFSSQYLIPDAQLSNGLIFLPSVSPHLILCNISNSQSIMLLSLTYQHVNFSLISKLEGSRCSFTLFF